MREREIDRMAHVIQSSLQSALLNLQCLAETVPATAVAPERELVELIRDELMRGSRLLGAAFEVLSLDLGEMTTINLGPLVRRALAAHGLRRVTVADGAWPVVVVDPRLLSLAVAHLARNAREATPAHGRPPEIAPEVRTDGGVDVVVRDWGSGLGALKLPGRAFRSTRPDHLAIGLLSVERIARLHGGALSITSSRRGTRARLSLPARSTSGSTGGSAGGRRRGAAAAADRRS